MNARSTSSKTPYEIRLELLQMAKDHLDATFKAQVDFALQMTTAMVAANTATVEEMKRLIPQPYTVDDITAKASELYSFILKKE